VVLVHLELGTNNAVFIRGQGGGLNWEAGQALTQLEQGTWIWWTDLKSESVEFQLLLDDLVWERGHPHVLEPGHTIHISPDFEWPEIPRVSSACHSVQSA
jgi:hypothetical protein